MEITPTRMQEGPWHLAGANVCLSVGQTQAWLHFIRETQQAVPVLGEVRDGADHAGWFFGAVTRRGGLRQLGSPLPGWTTSAMGFDLEHDVDPSRVLQAVPEFVRTLRCWHVELADERLISATLPAGFRSSPLRGYRLELAGRSDEDLLSGMRSNGRRDVRRAIRNDVRVETVDPQSPGTFVPEYMAQLRQAFAKRGLKPTYGPERVESLLRHLGPTGHLLLLRARTPGGEPAASAIFTGVKGGTAEFWGGASDRRLQHLLPNEALMWHALVRWRDLGAAQFSFGGGGSYKRKYGGTEHAIPWVRWSRIGALEHARRSAIQVRSRVRGRPRDPDR